MKLKLVYFLLFVSVSMCSVAQEKIPELDKSPLDMSYYPADYPLLKAQDKAAEPLLARVVYSRPGKKERKIFGGLIEYGKVWRLGANEATEIEFYRDVAINKVKVKKGRYTLYAIPMEDKWILIVNKETDTWGSFKYDSKKDVVRAELPVSKPTEIIEYCTLYFEKADKGISLQILWDDVSVSLPIEIPSSK